jgi:transposase-like protein
MLQRIRFALNNNSFEKMHGVIQVDESYIGGKMKNKPKHKRIANAQGRSLKDKVPVFGMIQTGVGVHVEVIPDTKGKTIKPIIEKRVKEGSIIISDEWWAYNNLDKKFFHVELRHNEDEYARGGFHNNSIEGFWSLLKRGILGIYHRVSPKHLQKYCDEFAYRYNTRLMKDGDRFKLSVKKMNGRLMYKDLIKDPILRKKKSSSLK